MTKLLTAKENAQKWLEDHKKVTVVTKQSDNFDIHSTKHLKKLLCYHEFICVEFPNIMLKFLPEGTLHILGKQPRTPLIHKWSARHTPEGKYVLQTIPSLFNYPQDMLLIIESNDNMTLEGLDKNNKEILHLIRHKIK